MSVVSMIVKLAAAKCSKYDPGGSATAEPKTLG